MQDRARRIIETMAGERRVEQMVCSVAHTDRLAWDLKDLCQDIYVILLCYPEDKIVDLWETGCMTFFLVRIITNSLRSKTSRFYYIYRRFSALCDALDGRDFPE